MFLRKYGSYLFGGFTFFGALVFYYIKPNVLLEINMAAILLFVVAGLVIITSLIIDCVRLNCENSNLKLLKKQFFNVNKIVLNSENSVTILSDSLKNYSSGIAVSIYVNEEDVESYLYYGAISEEQSNGLVQVIIPNLTEHGIQALLNRDNWPKLKIKTTFPYSLVHNLLTQNSALAEKIMQDENNKQYNNDISVNEEEI